MSSPSPTPLTPTSTLPLRTTPPVSIPVLGFGIYKSPPSQCVRSVQKALSVGYRHIDSAQFYGNEAEMGEAVRRSGIPRAEVFLTTKIMSPGGSPEKTYQKCVESVRKISRGTGRMDERGTKEDGEGEEKGKKGKETEGTEAKEAKEDDEYVDLFLIHSSSGGPDARKEMWLALERLLSQGKTRAIGVSNYGVGHIEEMKAYATIWPPHVNQIELHPWCQQRTITSYCTSHSIVISAYCPLVRNRKASSTVLVDIARAQGKTTAQILIRYGLQKGWTPLPKSDDERRIEENRDVFGWELSGEEMDRLDALDEGEQGAIVEAVKNG